MHIDCLYQLHSAVCCWRCFMSFEIWSSKWSAAKCWLNRTDLNFLVPFWRQCALFSEWHPAAWSGLQLFYLTLQLQSCSGHWNAFMARLYNFSYNAFKSWLIAFGQQEWVSARVFLLVAGIRKTYWITCTNEPDMQHVALDRESFPSHLVVKPCDLNRLLGNFQSSLQEITIIATEPSPMSSLGSRTSSDGKAVELRSYIDPAKGGCLI